MRATTVWTAAITVLPLAAFSTTCESQGGDTDLGDDNNGGDMDADADADADTDGDADADADADTDADADADTDADGDSDTGTGCVDQDSDWWCTPLDCNDQNASVNPGVDEVPGNFVDDDCDGSTDETESTGSGIDTDTGPIEQDCSSCPAVGTTLDHMRCAIDLCDDDVFLWQSYTSPTSSPTNGTYAAVAHFGNLANDLAPKLNGSYALMATGPATGTSHSTDVGGSSTSDPFSSDGYPVYNVMEWRLHLAAPAQANGFAITYVFFSEEYDDYVGTAFNDKFYIFIEAQSTNNGQRTVINYTDCRNPSAYYDFAAPACNLPSGYCCYIAINTSLSECCWYQGCPNGTWTTNIQGTGYVCANGPLLDDDTRGSSTGWLVTEWPVQPNEEFDIIFHIHDTSDGIFDSEVILDKFQFMGQVNPGTHPE